jgi:hypothetical protein
MIRKCISTVLAVQVALGKQGLALSLCTAE